MTDVPARPEPLPDSSARFLAAAADAGLVVEPTVFPFGTRTAAQAADAIGCDVASIVKSLVFMVDETPVLVLMPGDQRVDVDKLAREASGKAVRRATLEEVRTHTGYVAGGTPPIGHAEPIPVFADRRLQLTDRVWAAAGTPNTVFPVGVDDLVGAAGARWVDVAEGSD